MLHKLTELHVRWRSVKTFESFQQRKILSHPVSEFGKYFCESSPTRNALVQCIPIFEHFFNGVHFPPVPPSLFGVIIVGSGFCQMEGVEWASKFLRAWLSLEVISTPKPQQGQQQQKRQDEATDAVKEGAGWFVMARVQGTVIDAPTDGVERRFTSFFSKVALKLDSKAFPEVASVEVRHWNRGGGEAIHWSVILYPLRVSCVVGLCG